MLRVPANKNLELEVEDILFRPPGRLGGRSGQARALRCELPAHLCAPITFAFYTGCRKGEVLALRLDQIDFGERLVRLNPGETKNEGA